MSEESKPANFIRNIIADDLKTGKFGGRVVTRFPPEPNGHLHIGHAKSICLNFGTASENKDGSCFLRFDDTDPENESIEFMESQKADVTWLGFDWGDRLTNASDYFEKLHDSAVQLIEKGKAYVCSLNAEEIRAARGTLKEPGKESPYRNRSVEENLKMFAGMRAGEYEDGAHVLRAKIDMASGNINMRDPIIYRIKRATHHLTGDKWCIYPMYDFTHCLSDSYENITHSLCTLEFQDHRPLYDWVLDELQCESHPQQIEFSRLFLNFTIVAKRKLKALVDEKHVNGWDDPRMPTVSGLRRRGYTPTSIRNFCETVGISKSESITDMSILEESVREDLNKTAPRAMCVINALKVVIESYPEGKTETVTPPNHPGNPDMGTRDVPFSRIVYIEHDDFMEEPPNKYFRLAPGREVRLRNSYVIKCEKVIKDDAGKVVELHCSHDPDTLGKKPEGRKVKGIIHWVSAEHAVKLEVRLYDRLFNVENPGGKDVDFLEHLNPDSLVVKKDCLGEPGIASGKYDLYQFERLGYFCKDSIDSSPEALVFNRTVTLRDTWKK